MQLYVKLIKELINTTVYVKLIKEPINTTV